MSNSNHDIEVVKIYFDLALKTSEGTCQCRRCGTSLKDNNGHGNSARHVYNKHSDELKEKLDIILKGPTRGGMDSYVIITKTISPEAKDMYGWIEWIVMADLPIYCVENEY